MVQVMLPEPGGSYLCEKCFLEYGKTGKCECGGDISFISMHSNRYLSVWMKSRKALENRETTKKGTMIIG